MQKCIILQVGHLGANFNTVPIGIWKYSLASLAERLIAMNRWCCRNGVQPSPLSPASAQHVSSRALAGCDADAHL